MNPLASLLRLAYLNRILRLLKEGRSPEEAVQAASVFLPKPPEKPQPKPTVH